MITQLKTWGNSHGIRLTKEMLEKSGIQIDELLNVTASEGRILIERTFQHKTLEERAAEFNGSLNLEGEIILKEPKGREVW